jgi:ABC-type multidrug transport system permease subunit
MKPKLLLRIASILIFIHSALHTLGFSGWKKAPDHAEQQVISQMTGHSFPFMGATHSLADYYDGFGYGCSIALFLIAVLFWIVSGELSSNTGLAKKMIIALGIALLFWGIDELIFFFPFATSITLIACVCSFWAVYLLKDKKQAAA